MQICKLSCEPNNKAVRLHLTADDINATTAALEELARTSPSQRGIYSKWKIVSDLITNGEISSNTMMIASQSEGNKTNVTKPTL